MAIRYAYIEEPNAIDRLFENKRKELTFGANWFFSGHNSKVTLDVSRLSIDDGLLATDASDSRIRLQWDVQF